MTPQARQVRQRILRAAHTGGDANLQSAFSSVEILLALYGRVLRGQATQPGRDRFVLSKGQSNLALLAVLAQRGELPEEELRTYCRYDSRLSMQADRTKLPLVEASAGSLGHGFPIAAGMAWADKMKGCAAKVYVLAGDGEMNEGTMWEAAMFASSERLQNLTLIVDDNRSTGGMIDLGDLADKLRAFGFDTREADGHDEDGLAKVLLAPAGERPRAVLARTRRGYGSKTLMEDSSWFHRAPNGTELAALLKEVEDF